MIFRNRISTLTESGSAGSSAASMPPRKMLEGEREILSYASLAPEEALVKQNVSDKGLTDAEIEGRRAQYGTNEIEKKKKLGFIGEILARMKNPLVIQLMV